MILQDPHRNTIRDRINDGRAEYYRRSIIEQAVARALEELQRVEMKGRDEGCER